MFRTKIKAFLLTLYPELARFPIFAKIQSDILPVIAPRLKKIMRWALPIGTLFIVLIFGINIGMLLLGLYRPRVITPNPIEFVTPVVTNSYQSAFLPLQRSVQNFNPQLPDPLPPVFDNMISLEPIAPQ